jgi:type IV pilus assembly protein PilC
MPKYCYTGSRIDGSEVTGSAEALDLGHLELDLLNSGITLNNASIALPWSTRFLLAQFKRSLITRVTRQLALLFASRISVTEALELAREQVSDKQVGSILQQVLEQIQAGKPLAVAMREHPYLFDDLYTSMVEAGEMSGTLDFVFDGIAVYRERRETALKKIRSALAYPALVVVVAVLVVIALLVYVVPVFATMYDNFGAKLPAMTQTIVNLSDAIKRTFWYWFGGFAALGLGGGLISTRQGAKAWFHKTQLTLPILRSLTRKLVTARLCRTMGSLLSAGVDILTSLQIASRTTGNVYVVTSLRKSLEAVESGAKLSDSLKGDGIFPPAMLRLVSSGEAMGNLGEMFSRAADYYEAEVTTETAMITALIEPIIIIVLGAFIATVLLAMYLPLFSLTGVVH